ncbi:MAG: VIT family protein [Oligoflexia bacterium]|nr:VIT family protein [Oligoflexia bacterium]
MRTRPHQERHKSERTGWLRAAVLGSNDAIVSTASLMLGVAASNASKSVVLISGVSGLVAGAMSMAVGEFVSVSSQKDAFLADLEQEKMELATQPKAELKELTNIYIKRGLNPSLAAQVAEELSASDRLAAHLRDELGFNDGAPVVNPFEAAWVSAVSFSVFALIPVIGLAVVPREYALEAISVLSLLSLAVLGAFGAYIGGAPRGRAALRVVIGGIIAMAVTTGIGRIMGISFG